MSSGNYFVNIIEKCAKLQITSTLSGVLQLIICIYKKIYTDWWMANEPLQIPWLGLLFSLI